MSAIIFLDRLQKTFNKGFALAELIYEDLYMRHIGDIDLLIYDEDLLRVDQLLRQSGFFPACGKDKYWEIKNNDDYYILPRPVLRDRISHEYFTYYKPVNISKGVLYLRSEIGRYIHQTVKESHIRGFLENSRDMVIFGQPMQTFDVIHTLLILFENAYDDAENWFTSVPILRNYLDLYLFITKHKENICWGKLKELLIKYNMHYEVKTAIEYLLLVYDNGFDQETLHNLMSISNENGSKPERYINRWDIDFLTRLFISNSERDRLIGKMAMKNCFNDTNENFNKPLILRNDTESELYKIENAKNYNLYYSVELKGGYIVFRIHVEEQMLNKEKDHEFYVYLINNKENEFTNANSLVTQKVIFSTNVCFNNLEGAFTWGDFLFLIVVIISGALIQGAGLIMHLE